MPSKVKSGDPNALHSCTPDVWGIYKHGLHAPISKSRTAVFLGPTLPLAEARIRLEADYYPPVEMGGIYRLLASGLRTIVILDGYFHGRASVWQREIIAAIQEGIQVIGAASMGALRAAELSSHGMIGVGRIYEGYRDGMLTGDDEVALVHSDSENAYRQLSTPLVNIRATLREALRRRLINEDESNSLIAFSKSTHYPGRSFSHLLSHCMVSSWPESKRFALETFLSTEVIDQKAEDAREALSLAAKINETISSASDLPPEIISRDPFAAAKAFTRGLPTPNGLLIEGSRVIQTVCADAGWVKFLWRKLNSQMFILMWAAARRITCPAGTVEQFERDHKAHFNFEDPAAWMSRNGITRLEYQESIRRGALLTWIYGQSTEKLMLPSQSRRLLTHAILLWQNKDSKNTNVTEQPVPSPVLRARLIETAIHGAWARQQGIRLEAEDVEKAAKTWESQLEITDRREFLRLASLEESAYLELVEERAVSSWMVEKGPNYFGYSRWCHESELLIELQMSGRLQEALERCTAEKSHE